jgi:uncharacterized protein (TIGR02145 family)
VDNPRWIVSSRACLAITALVVAICSFITFVPVQAEYTDETSSDLNLSVSPVVSLSISNCDNSPADSVTLSIEPTSDGAFSSTCQNITVAANTPGYSLLVKTDSTNLIYQNPTSITPAPIVASTDKLIDNPDILPNDSWGFAIENQLNFDSTYTTNNADNKYAKLLTTDQTIYQTDKALGETPAPLSNFTAYYGARLTLATIAGDYKTTITYTAVGADVPELQPTTMQAMTQDYCANTMEVYTNNNDDDKLIVLTDIRNSQDYLVGKLADGNCWMLNNLKLGSTSPIILDSTDANISFGTTFELPAFETRDGGAGSAYNSPRIYADDFDSGADKSATTDIYSSDFYGYYYNWCAATAGTTSTTCKPDSAMPPHATQDICPVNWRLPTGGGGSDEFGILSSAMAAAKYNSAYLNFQFEGPFRGVFAGFRASSLWRDYGSQGYVWSASHAWGTSEAASKLSFSDSAVLPSGDSNRNSGFSVRCLLQ